MRRFTEAERKAYVKKYKTTTGVSRHRKMVFGSTQKCRKCKKRKANAEFHRRPDNSLALRCKLCTAGTKSKRIDPWTELDC